MVAVAAGCGEAPDAEVDAVELELDQAGHEQRLGRPRGLVIGGLPTGHHAFNPGLVRYRGQLVMVFRIEQHGPRNTILANRLAAVRLDDAGEPREPWAYLTTPRMVGGVDTAEDPRLIEHQGRVFVVYTLSDNDQRMGPRRLHVSELVCDPNSSPATWRLGPDHRLVYAPRLPDGRPGVLPRIEKNWSPFVYDDALHFLYRSNPTEVLRLENDDLFADARDVFPKRVEPASRARIAWGLGEMRGGTPAVFEPSLNRYVTFFHSRWMCRVNGKPAREHYFTGFYSFRPEPPFDIDQIYARPLGFPRFVEQVEVEGHATIVYVQGAVADGNRYLLSYGLGDTALGLMEVDREGLLAGLTDPKRLPGPPFSTVQVTVDPVCDR